MTGDPNFSEKAADDIARPVRAGHVERAERLATSAFSVEAARKALEELERTG